MQQNPRMKMNFSYPKRKFTPQSEFSAAKKLRSDLPRRRRTIFSPVAVLSNHKNPDIGHSKQASGVSVLENSIASDEVSCNTTTRDSLAGEGNRNDELREATRSDSKQKEIERAKWMIGGEADLSESSCVESSSIAEVDSKFQSKINGISRGGIEANFSGDVAVGAVPNSASTIEQSNWKRSRVGESVLACSENLSDEDGCELSSSTFSEIQSESLGYESEFDFLSDTSCLWTDNSGSQFSQQSAGDSNPSPLMALCKHYSEQLTRLSSSSCNGLPESCVDESANEFTYWRFEDEDDEQSYQRLRSRERKRSLKMDDYVSAYASTSEYGVLIHEQRLLMVDWIVETSDQKDFHDETTFLAIRLLDRFLSKGFFSNKRNLELVGIACLTLATRIEENQPQNCIRQKIFYVNENVYCRTEVVAMEWLVQKELKFQCLSPTTFNFLWFYLKAAAADEQMESVAKHLVELAMFDHRQLRFWPSSVAAGIVMLASLATKQDESCLRVMKAHIRTNTDDLPECIKSLDWLVRYASCEGRQ